MLSEIIIESFGLVVATFVGIFYYRLVNGFYRLLFIQLISWLFLYVLSYMVTEYQRSKGMSQNNQWVFNLQILFETTLLLFAANLFFQNKFAKRMLMFTWVLFLLFYASRIVAGNFFEFDVASYSVESILIIVVYTLILFTSFYEVFTIEVRKPEVWASTGLILYFGCNLPYFSLFNFLNNNYPEMSETLHKHVTDVFSNVRYLMLAIGFILVSKTSSTVTQVP